MIKKNTFRMIEIKKKQISIHVKNHWQKSPGQFAKS